MISRGRIVAADPGGGILIRLPWTPEYLRRMWEEADVLLVDGRKISPEQRRKAWVLIGEIAAWAGYRARERQEVNADLKREFLLTRTDQLTAKAIGAFSLSDVDMETASLYITFLIDFIIEHGVPTREPLTELCEDIRAAVYTSLIHKRCVICGKPSELHHVDRVGMGRDRHDICHIGMACLPLCRLHHDEAHQHGDHALMDKYHLEAVMIDSRIAKIYSLKEE